MDMSNVTRSMWIVIGGTIATLLGTLLFDWYSITRSVTVEGRRHNRERERQRQRMGHRLDRQAGSAGIARDARRRHPHVHPQPAELPVPLPMAMLGVSAFTALMVVLKFIDIHSDTALGLWLSLIGSLVAAYGAYEMGGRFSMSSSS